MNELFGWLMFIGLGISLSSLNLIWGWRQRKKLRELEATFDKFDNVEEYLGNDKWEYRFNALQKLTHGQNFLQQLPLLLKALQDPNKYVRRQAFEIVEKKLNVVERTLYRSAISPHQEMLAESIAYTLDDEKWKFRKRASRLLGKLNATHSIAPLFNALEDTDSRVRKGANSALKSHCKSIQIVNFDREKFSLRPQESSLTLSNPDVSNLTVPMNALTRVIIDADTCNVHIADIFATYMTQHLDKNILKKQVDFYINGNPLRLSSNVYQACELCKEVHVSIERLVFGSDRTKQSPYTEKNLFNPDLFALTIPLRRLKEVVIHSETYDFHLVERFLTYAVNYLGQDYLKRNVEMFLVGPPEKLHPNLRNNLTHLCKGFYLSTVH